MPEFTINQAITRAREILTARSTDARLAQAERTQANETVTVLTDILTELADGNVLAENRRQAVYDTLVDRRHVLNVIQQNHEADIPTEELYNAIDLTLACEEPLLLGLDELVTADG